jgi:glycosyltransferase involved in cell wall biosynthesis
LSPAADIALVSLRTTPGLQRSDDAFAALVRRAGATCEVVPVRIGAARRLRRGAAMVDLVEALAARRSAAGVDARAVVYSTITTALLARPAVPFGIRFDALARLNRPGPGGAWQRRREIAVLDRAALLMPVSRGAAEAAAAAGARPPAVRVPIPIEPIPGAALRDIDAVAYAADPRKRGLELLCAGWAQAAPRGARLVVGGIERSAGLAWLRRHGVPEPDGVEWAGALPRERWIACVARARLFLAASRWEDFGIAPMEGLAAGAALVTVPTPGSYEALPLARELAPELVAAEVSASSLAEALRAGFGLVTGGVGDYRERALELLAPYREDAVASVVARDVLPALGIDPR